MKLHKPIFWHQGLFLQPQHFQQADAFHQAGAHALFAGQTPHPFGALALDVDVDRFASGVFEVTRGAFVFKDGTLAATPDNALLPARDFRDALAAQNRGLTVYVGLRRSTRTESNVTEVANLETGEAGATRYVAEAQPEPSQDMLQSGAATAQVKTLNYVLRLFWETELEQAEAYELLALGRLVQDGEAVTLDAGHVPPVITVSASTTLVNVLKEIREELIGRARQLEEYKGGAEVGGQEFSPKMLRYRLALQVLARYAPMLAHLVETPTVHPWQVYGLLRQLLGEISPFSADMDILGQVGGDPLPIYDHERLGHCFGQAKRRLEKALNEITLGPERIIALSRSEPGMFTAELPREFMERNSTLYLVLRTEENFEDLLGSFVSYAKFGAEAQVQVLAQRALPGVPATYLRVRPESLPQRPNSSYFRIERHDPNWETVEQQRSIALLWDEAPEDLKVDVVMVRG